MDEALKNFSPPPLKKYVGHIV